MPLPDTSGSRPDAAGPSPPAGGTWSGRVFLLSPAHCGGRRAKQVLSPNAGFALAGELRSSRGAMLGDVFTFISGLYFRGKLTYALRFAAPPERGNAIVGCGVHIITPNAGLRSPDTCVTQKAVISFADGDVHQDNASYRRPLERSARALAREIGPDCDVVLLGSIASPKYVDVLLAIFGDRLRFPIDFVGRGDMSRGGLLLRKSREGVELDYLSVRGAVLHGARPPKLPPLHARR
jgi:hypothetical protein